MKKISYFISSAMVLMTSGICAKEKKPTPPPEPVFYIKAGPHYTHVNLKPQHNSSFRGNLGGAQALFEYRPLDQIYGGVGFLWSQGQIHGESGKRFLLDFHPEIRL